MSTFSFELRVFGFVLETREHECYRSDMNLIQGCVLNILKCIVSHKDNVLCSFDPSLQRKVAKRCDIAKRKSHSSQFIVCD